MMRRRLPPLLCSPLVLITACSPDSHIVGEPNVVITGARDLPSSDDALATSAPTVEDDALVPAWGADEMDDALARFGAGLHPTGHDLVDAWEFHLAHGTQACPGFDGNLRIAEHSCTTDDGWFFSGIGGYQLEESDSRWRMSSGGELRFVGTDDEEMVMAGNMALDMSSAGSGQWTWDLRQTGGLRATDISEAAEVGFGGLYLAAGVATVTGQTIEVGSATFDGAVGVGDVQLSFTELGLHGPDCGNGASGILSIRDPVGAWWALEYGDCSECPEVVRFNAVEVDPGEICPDAVGALDDWVRGQLSPVVQ